MKKNLSKNKQEKYQVIEKRETADSVYHLWPWSKKGRGGKFREKKKRQFRP